MNNNNNQNGKESDIITKKGFLISLPGKKNNDAGTTSSIHMSSDAPAKDVKGDKTSKDVGKKHHDRRKDNRDNRNNQNKQDVKGEAVQGDNRSRDNGFKGKNGKNRDKFRRDRNNADNAEQNVAKNTENQQQSEKAVKPEGGENRNDRNDRKAKHGKNFGRDKKHGEDRGDRQEKNDKNDRNDRNEKPLKNDRNDRNDRSDRNRHVNNDKKQKNMTPLSALSAEISRHEEKKQAEVINAVKEPSLEEKYKNAKPLAQQIAEQEMRNRGIKVPSENDEPQESVEIVGVRFREAGKIYYFDPGDKKIPFGTPVIVETARGSEYGYTAISNRLVPCNSLLSPLKPIERIATEIDTQKHEANRDLEAHAESVFKEKVAKLGLEMNLIYVEYTFDNSRLLFYFTAETRIDFRELVKELAGVFRTRIELRQIGVRDEAKAIGGIGVCGRANCCNTFLGDFAQVSIKMAKDQSLSLNAAKISGACGKLMCCLRYEDKVYEEENARTPKVGSIVETPEGRGHVVERNVLKGTVKVALDLAPEAAAQPFSRDDVKVVGFNKSKSGEDNLDDNLDELKDAEG